MSRPVISFDLDGVIMRGPWQAGIRPRVWSYLVSAPGLAHLAAEERERRVTAEVLSEHNRRLEAGKFVDAWNWDAIYAAVACCLGGQPVPQLAPMVRECCQLEDTIALLPGARAALERTAAAGGRIVAITNGYHAYQWPVLEALGIAALFEAIITPDQAGFAKPDPRVFQSVPGLVAHVGDILLHDVLGANLAGVCSVWVQAELPDHFRGVPPRERSHAPGFADYLSGQLEQSRYRRYHPEGTLETCTPDIVATDPDEAAQALLSSLA